MFSRKLAAIGAAVALALGLGATPAHATVLEQHLQNMAIKTDCLDYRADYGPYTTGCNEGAFQTWIMNLDPVPTALRQNAGDRLCLVARNGVATMKPCLADDPAALWRVTASGTGTYKLINNVTRTCLGAGSGAIHHASLVTCTGGDSQQWSLYG